MSAPTRTATDEDVALVWPAARADHLFDDLAAFERWRAEEPWRVRVTDDGDAVVLERWRDHLDLLSIRGLWAPGRRTRALVEDLSAVAHEHGYGALLGPLLPEEAIGPYAAAGMRVAQRLIVLRLQPATLPANDPPTGVSLRPGCPDDLAALAELDASCFDSFWRYDEALLTRFAAAERLTVAVREQQPIGYTLCAPHGAEATVGRLAVLPEARRCGVGSALMAEAVTHLASSGAAAVTLCTQDENAAARRFYRELGFRELRGRLVAALRTV